MPSPFKQHKDRLNKKNLKPGSLMYDLREINRDIRKAKRGEETEESMEVMKDARRRYKQAIREESKKEQEAMLREMDPRQKPAAAPSASPKMETASFKIKPASGMAAARG